MVKDDKYYIEKSLQEINLIIEYSVALKNASNDGEKAILDGIVFRMIQMSEHISLVSDELKKKYYNIPWVNIKGFRNRLVHDYGNVDLAFVYDAINNDIPQLKDFLSKVLNDLEK